MTKTKQRMSDSVRDLVKGDPRPGSNRQKKRRAERQVQALAAFRRERLRRERNAP